MSLCCVCILTSPQKTVSALLNYLILSTTGRSCTALSEEGAQLFRNKGSNHLLPIRSAAAPRTFAGWGREHTENIRVAVVHTAHVVTSHVVGCPLFPVPIYWFIYMLYCVAVNIPAKATTWESLKAQKKKNQQKRHPTSPEVQNHRMQYFSWQLDHNFRDNTL